MSVDVPHDPPATDDGLNEAHRLAEAAEAPRNPDRYPSDLDPFDAPRLPPDDAVIQQWYDKSTIEAGIAADPSLSEEDKDLIRSWFRRILRDFREMFDDSSLPPVRGTLVTIPHERVVHRPGRPIRDPVKLKAFTEIVQSMLRRGIIRPSSSPYNHQAFLVPKQCPKSQRASDMWRLVNDLSGLNQVMRPLKIDPPPVSAIFSALQGATTFSALDMVESFWQMRLADDAAQCTAFQVPPADRYEFCRAPMGMQSSSSWMERNVRRILSGFASLCTIN